MIGRCVGRNDVFRGTLPALPRGAAAERIARSRAVDAPN